MSIGHTEGPGAAVRSDGTGAAAGDVRAGASKPVAGSVGDGALVVRFAYDVLFG